MNPSDKIEVPPLPTNPQVLPSQHQMHDISNSSTIKSLYVDTSSNSPSSSSSAELKLINRARLQLLQKPINFNVLMLGDCHIGKTSFINSLLIKYFCSKSRKPQAQERFLHTTSITDNFAEISNSETEFRVNLIDTPGYGYLNSKEVWLEEITQMILNRIQDYKSQKKRVNGKSQVRDTRINAAVYFIEGPRCKETDLDLMFRLQKFVCLIPVIAKADSYSYKELVQVKLQVVSQCAEAGIKFFDVASAMQDSVGVLNSCVLEPVPPFAIISAGNFVEKAGTSRFIREYSWGTCDIHDESVSDFKIFCRIFFGYLVVPLIKASKDLNRTNGKLFKAITKQRLEVKRFSKIKRISSITSRLILHIL